VRSHDIHEYIYASQPKTFELRELDLIFLSVMVNTRICPASEPWRRGANARESTSAKQNIARYLTHKEISKALNMLSFLSPNVQSLSQNILTCAKGNSDKLLSLFSLSLCSHLHVPKPIALLCITYILCLTQLGSKILCLITYPCRPWPWKGKLIYIY
jgi:hypothetical protein